MRLRQKLFAAILAVMAVVFSLLALTSILDGLNAQRTEHELRERLEFGAAQSFSYSAAHPSAQNWVRLCHVMLRLGFEDDWCVRRVEDGAFVCSKHRIDPKGTHEVKCQEGLVSFSTHHGFELLLPLRPAELGALGGLSGLFWAVAAGTVFLLLVIYGLLLRLVLRPVEDLVAASRVLSSGKRPGKVAGESRGDEMGELIGAFNIMADEVCQTREELRARVDEATREYERAQKRLVLEQRLAATGKLAAGIAHEINNPLGGMINAARALSEKEGALSERGREYLGLIEEGLGRIAGIVERMRAFVKPRPLVGPVDLGEAVGSAVAFVRHRLDKESVQLREEIPPELVTVTGDAGELQQVFLNLILNAVDAMRDSQTRELTLRLQTSGEEAVLSVTDTGLGMDAEQLASAFDLFYSTKGEGGTGLGLAIAHKIVTDHGGAIDIESSPGGGTTARVRMPLAGAGGEESGHS